MAPTTSTDAHVAARRLGSLGALLAGLAVAAGAFGAHALANVVSADRLATFETAARYQMYHALALLFVAWATPRFPAPWLRRAAWLFIAGIVLFSGSLYLLVLTDTPWLGAVTPLGGIAFLSGWGLLAWALFRERTPS